MFSSSQPMQEDEEILALFNSWGLVDKFISLLNEHGVQSFLVLQKIEIEDLDTLFQSFDKTYFGEFVKFKTGLRNWRKEMQIPFICDRDTESANSRILNWLEKISDELSAITSTESTPLSFSPQTSNCYNLVDLLKQTVRGQLVLSFQDKNGSLDTKNQKTLTHCIVDNYISTGRKMSYSDMRQWANSISEIFPKENPETYYLDRKIRKRNPSGKLFSRWANAVKMQNKDKSEVTDLDVDISEEELLEKKCWLMHNCTPWDQVKSFWKDTFTTRIKSKGSLTDLLSEWPRYNDANGYELVDIDFEKIQPGMGNQLFLKVDNFYKKIFPILEKEVKDHNSRELLLSKLYNKTISNDSKYCIVMLLLHALLQPQRRTKTFKPTIQDAQWDFLILATTPNDVMPKILEKIKEYADKKKTLQPRIVVVGTDFSDISEFYIFCDGLKWKCCSFMKCIECIIKLSYVFQIEYSHNSKQVWAFLEQYFFGLKSENFSSVSNLLSKLDS